MNANTILTSAADLIVKKGWTQKQYQDDAGCLCALGAIILAGGGTLRYDEEGKPDDYNDNPDGGFGISDAMKALESVVGREATLWNDDPDREASDVVDALRAAARRVAA